MEGWRQKFKRIHSLDNILESDRYYAKNIITRFKKENVALIKLNPEIGIDQYTIDSEGKSCNEFALYVGHKFIFDYRLLPAHFENIKVNSHLCVNMPKEFPSLCPPGLQLDEYHAPERYVLFVQRYLEKIGKELKTINLSFKEALDALTGDFDRHKNWANKIKNERIMKNKEHIRFFNELLEKTKEAYLESEVFKNYGHKNWGYSITATSFEKNAKVIVGFNWGVDNKWIDQGNSYGPQKEYPLKNFVSLYEELGSFKRTINHFYRYFDDLPEVQINYCFFRSEKEEQISARDLDLCNTLFDELIEYLEPSMLISFSKSLNNFLITTGKLNNINIQEINSGNIIISTTKGKLRISKKEIDYFNLPHPNYPIKSESRKKAWDFCFKEFQ